MKFLLFFTIILLTTIDTSFAQVSVEYFAAKSEFIDMKISPDGKHYAFTYEDDSQMRLGIIKRKNHKGISSFSMSDKREVSDFWWANNNRLVVLSQKETGWLDGKSKGYKLFAINIDGKKRKLLWGFESSFLRFVSILENEHDYIMVSKHHYSDNFTGALQKININTAKMSYLSGTPKLKGGNDSAIIKYIVDNMDVPRVAIEYDPKDKHNLDDDTSYIHIKALNGKWQVLELPSTFEGRPVINELGFNKDNTKFYFASNYDLEQAKNTGFFELDIKTNSANLLFRHEDVDIQRGLLGSNGEIIGVVYEAGYPGYYYLKNSESQNEANLFKKLRASFKGQEVVVGKYTKNKSLTILKVYSDKNPGTFYLYDSKKAKIKFIANTKKGIDPKVMASVEPFIINARDGLKMYGQLTIPNGVELKNLPMVVFPHGGPYGVADRWGWDSRAQLMASRGYLVLQLNYRGSGNYGTLFMEEGYNYWGTLMQDDLTDATLWAVNQGYADRNNLCIHGVSYGGYAAMNAVVREPDLYKCSIPDAGIYNIELQWKKSDSFKQNPKLRKDYLNRSFGTDSDKLVFDARSPAMNVDKVKASLFLVHGTEDVRVPIANAHFLEKELKKAGKIYEKIYKKEGHGFQKVNNRIELFNKMIEFLDKNIGKRNFE